MGFKPDTTASQIIANIVKALQTATTDAGDQFYRVVVVPDVESFLHLQNMRPGAVAGVIFPGAQRSPGMDNSDDHLNYMQPDIIVGIYQTVPVTGDVTHLATRADRLIDMARQALLADRTRGGLCLPIRWKGKLIKATESYGDCPAIKVAKSAVAYARRMPVEVAWPTPRVKPPVNVVIPPPPPPTPGTFVPMYLNASSMGNPGATLTGYIAGGDGLPNFRTDGYGEWINLYSSLAYPPLDGHIDTTAINAGADAIACDGEQVSGCWDSEVIPPAGSEAAYAAWYAALITAHKVRHPSQRVALIANVPDSFMEAAGVFDLLDYCLIGPYLATYSAPDDASKFTVYKQTLDAAIARNAGRPNPKPVIVEFPLQYFNDFSFQSLSLIQQICSLLLDYFSQGKIHAAICFAGYQNPDGTTPATWVETRDRQYFNVFANTFKVGTQAVPYPVPPYT